MNIPRYLSTGRGKNINQGSITLHDETVEGECTKLNPGFHRHIKTRWKGVHGTEQEDELTVGGLVHSVGKLWKSEHARAYGGFLPFPCKAGAVRVTRPEILHGSTASKGSTSARRTILPWFVGVQADYETLDIEESETWSELNCCHSTQNTPRATPSGQGNENSSNEQAWRQDDGNGIGWPAALQVATMNSVRSWSKSQLLGDEKIDKFSHSGPK